MSKQYKILESDTAFKDPRFESLRPLFPSAIEDKLTNLFKNLDTPSDPLELYKIIDSIVNRQRLRFKALKQKESIIVLKDDMLKFDAKFRRVFGLRENQILPKHQKPESVFTLFCKGIRFVFFKCIQGQPDHSNHHDQAVSSNQNSYQP